MKTYICENLRMILKLTDEIKKQNKPKIWFQLIGMVKCSNYMKLPMPLSAVHEKCDEVDEEDDDVDDLDTDAVDIVTDGNFLTGCSMRGISVLLIIFFMISLLHTTPLCVRVTSPLMIF